MTEYLNPAAELNQPDSGEMVTPTYAYSVRNTKKFFCPDFDCMDPQRILIVKKSSIGNPFFSHRQECGHDIRPETLLHKSAIKWLSEQTTYEIPAYNLPGKKLIVQTVLIDSSMTQVEFRQLKRIVPDVKLTTEKGFEFAIEIVVTNDISEEKLSLIQSFGLPTIRVNLIHFYLNNKSACRTDLDFIYQNLSTLLADSSLKSWVIPPIYELTKDKIRFEETIPGDGCLLYFIALTVCIIILLS